MLIAAIKIPKIVANTQIATSAPLGVLIIVLFIQSTIASIQPLLTSIFPIATTKINTILTVVIPATPSGIAPEITPSFIENNAEAGNKPAARPITDAVMIPVPNAAKILMPLIANAITRIVGIKSNSPFGF